MAAIRPRKFLVLHRTSPERPSYVIDTLETENWAVARGMAWKRRVTYLAQYGAGAILLVREIGEPWKTL